MGDSIYSAEQGRLVSHQAEECSKADGHVHTRRPRIDVPNRTTSFLGVKESYTSPKKAQKLMQKRGMDFYTLANHDCVMDAIELRRKHPENSFINCEYTVVVDAKRPEQVIHVGCWGLDYPGDAEIPLSDSIVRELHEELLNHCHLGYQRFIEYCESMGIAYVLNHPPWQGTPKNPLSGAQFDEITDAFDILEINGDMQLENLFTLEVALEKGKTLCAGTDAHTSRRIGNQYTATLAPAATPYEFLRAFKAKEIGIGSRFTLPESMESPTLYDIVKHQFNGSVSELQKDTFEGVWNYFLYEWGARKTATVTAASLASLGVSAGVGALAGPEYGLIPFTVVTALQALALFAIPLVIPRKEKNAGARRTRELYRDYHEHLLQKETREPRERIAFHEQEMLKHQQEIDRHAGMIREAEKRHSRELPEIISDPRRFEWLAFKYLRGVTAFGSDYDMSARIRQRKPDAT